MFHSVSLRSLRSENQYKKSSGIVEIMGRFRSNGVCIDEEASSGWDRESDLIELREQLKHIYKRYLCRGTISMTLSSFYWTDEPIWLMIIVIQKTKQKQKMRELNYLNDLQFPLKLRIVCVRRHIYQKGTYLGSKGYS